MRKIHIFLYRFYLLIASLIVEMPFISEKRYEGGSIAATRGGTGVVVVAVVLVIVVDVIVDIVGDIIDGVVANVVVVIVVIIILVVVVDVLLLLLMALLSAPIWCKYKKSIR